MEEFTEMVIVSFNSYNVFNIYRWEFQVQYRLYHRFRWVRLNGATYQRPDNPPRRT